MRDSLASAKEQFGTAQAEALMGENEAFVFCWELPKLAPCPQR
jgi:hypothetical protein